MMDLSETIKNIYAWRAQQQGYGHPLQLFLSRKFEERLKTTWGKSSLKKEKGTKLNKIPSTYFFLHLNELDELILIE